MIYNGKRSGVKGEAMTNERRNIGHRGCGPFLLCMGVLLLGAQIGRAQVPIDGKTNLIVNGGAESGPAGTATSLPSSIPRWTVTGKANVLPYGLTNYLLLTDPAPPDHGFQYFTGPLAYSGNATLTQPIDVSSVASTISGGNVKFTLSAYLGSLGTGLSLSPAYLSVAFQNANGQTFSNATLGSQGQVEVYAGLFLQEKIGLVPPGTVGIVVSLTLNSSNNQQPVADSLSLVLSTLVTSPGAVLGTNLVVNGNAEAGPSAARPTTTLYIPGWSTAGDASVAPYGGTDWIQLTDPVPPDHGVNLFCGGVTAQANIYQDIDVSPAATLIDSGQVTYQISAWLGGNQGYYVSPTLTYTFFDWNGNQVGTTAQLVPTQLPQGTVPETELVEASLSGTLPKGTRRVHIALGFPYAYSMADNINFTLSAPAGPPVIDPGGIISASGFGGFASIAPGTWIEIYGTNLTASAPLSWSGSNFVNGVAPTQLGDVTISVGGQPAFIDYVSPSQVNALVPSGAPISSGTVDITLTNSNGTSDPFALYVNETQAGLLAPSSFIINKKQYVVAILSDGSYALPANAIPGLATRPAMAGETAVLYGIGFGPVTPNFDAGTIVTAQNSLTGSLQVLFGNTAATLAYDGLAPNFTGLYQFNVVVPSVHTSDAVPLSFNLGGIPSAQTLYIAVQN